MRTRPATGRGDFIVNMKWRTEHAVEYAGKWVALRDGALVDSDESRVKLQKRLETHPQLSEMLFVQMGELKAP